MAYRLTLIILMLALSSCAWVRENNETFFYKSTLRAIDYSMSSRTAQICGRLNYKMRRPVFIQNASMTGFLGVTYPKTIEYKTVRIIPHETVHYLIMENQLSKECLEEMLADITAQLVLERRKQ